MPTPTLTPDEIVSTLRRSSLPTVITEGYEDYLVFRRIEEHFADRHISFLPVGGKDAVLELFRRRAEFSGIPAAFVVDKDLWLFNGIPGEFQNDSLIQTDGYSIENDLYRDGELEGLLLAPERDRFQRDCDAVCSWFSFAVRCNLKGREVPLDIHPNYLLLGTGTLNPGILTDDFKPHPALYQQILNEYAKYLRGKTLLALLIKFLSASGRMPKHSKRALMEYAACRDGVLLRSIRDRLSHIFGAPSAHS